MKIISLFKKTLVVVTLLGFMFPLPGTADQMFGHNCHKRPLSDFLDQQGSTMLFFPPVPDMLGWTDFELINFALVDYAGLANNHIIEQTGDSLGTKVEGRIIECARKDGTAKISVVLSTRKALGFAQSVQALIENNFDFLNTPTIFGVKAQDVVAGDEPALGPVSFRTTFIIDYPGATLPDIRIAFQQQVDDFAPITLSFKSTTVGTLPDGTRALLRVQQVASTNESNELVFSREIVEIVDAGADD